LNRKNELYLLSQGWESNSRKGIHERWRKRSFDKNNRWMLIQEALKKQKKWDRFWRK